MLVTLRSVDMTVESEASSPMPSCAGVLAFDSGMFEQAQRCLETVRAQCRWKLDLCAVAIDLPEQQLQWLRDQKVQVVSDLRRFPRWSGAPAYAAALTCRPYIPELFPGYDLYLWVDADLRFFYPDAFDFYLGEARAHPDSIAICQELDPAYSFVRNPAIVRAYHLHKYQRITRAHGKETADRMQYFQSFNCGIFAMHRHSPIWSAYRLNLQRAMDGPFDHMAEQDAMNVVLLEVPSISVAPTVMNWLCSACLPGHIAAENRWVRPLFPYLPIGVAHLANSNHRITVEGKEMSYYELYKQMGLTK